MRFVPTLIVSVVLVLAVGGCGDEDSRPASGAEAGSAQPGGTTQPASPPPTGGAVATVRGQETVLEFPSDGVLAREEVDVQPLAPAGREDGGILLPITGGRVELEEVRGTVDHAGGVAFVHGSQRVELRSVFVDTRTGTVYARVGGTYVRMFNLDTSDVDIRKVEDHVVAGGFQMTLADDGAAVLSEELDRELRAGQDIGSLRVRLLPTLPDAAGAPDSPDDVIEHEARDLQEQVRDLAEGTLDDLSREDRQQLEDAVDDLRRALENR